MSKSRFAVALAAVRDRIPGLSPHAYAPLEAASATVDIAGSDEPRDTPWGRGIGDCFNNYRSTPADARTSRLWGQYAPFFSVPSDIDPEVPSGCVVTFAQVLSRHGARDPTAYKTQVYNATVAKIQAGATKFAHGYGFLKDLEYTLGADQLTQFGIQQMLDQGRVMAERYGHLVRDDDDDDDGSDGGSALPFSGPRARTAEEEYLAAILVVPETEGFNNTLDHGGCTEFEGGPDSQLGNRARDAFADRFVPPVLRRLHEGLGASLHLTRDDVVAIMDLCPFYSVADPEGKLSDFCHLFTRDEWKSYDYYQSLGKYYGYGDGNPLGPTQGVGFVNELVARLTRRPVEDHTSTNTTLTGSPRTFPSIARCTPTLATTTP
ncbi:unnamed protein product [Parascedosporium putredinis]|uniref:3-phytase n=1 Tax=Parascedosporium putredinis TaxID=1442378 RepID=A0A9P1GYD4_9PEZI|nr:unnamed protein product [Parascedosporium putredinis]CAI7990648.1 unnamed protein product [Parascedosporium putredinis]